MSANADRVQRGLVVGRVEFDVSLETESLLRDSSEIMPKKI